MNLIADEKKIFESPNPQGIYCYTPGICLGFPGKNGRNRLIAACDFGGPDIKQLDGPTSHEGDFSGNQIRVKYSDDGGETWQESHARLPFRHEILFKAGNSLYMIGNDFRLVISRSTDNGETWSDPAVLDSRRWHQSCGAVDYHNGTVYLVYEMVQAGHDWPGVMPVLMAADENADLTKLESWRFSEPYNADPDLAECQAHGQIIRNNAGILETNVLRIHDPAHPFYDKEDRTVVLCMRMNSGFCNMGAILLGHDNPDRKLTIEKAILKNTFFNSELKLFMIPFPGGDLKFHIQYDEKSKLYWMVASQIDGVHCERRRLGLYFSENLLEWCFAGMVAVGPSENGSRHYATLCIDGNDILVLSRSGDEHAKSAHDNNSQTFHRVKDFRKLIY